MLHSRKDHSRERGQILVLFELVFIVILACAALVIDLGVLRNNKQILVNTFDAAALSGGSQLPVTGAANELKLHQLVDRNIAYNYSGSPAPTYTVTYKCLIGANASGPLISRDIPAVCDPRISLGIPVNNPLTASDITALTPYFTGAGLTRVSSCNPKVGDKCNVVLITGSATTNYALAPVVGINNGSSGTVVSAVCSGPCGAAPTVPVDLVVILDRTLSMQGSGNTKIISLQNAAKTILGVYDPTKQRVALGLTGPGDVDASGNPAPGQCDATGSGTTVYGAADDSNFFPTTTVNGGSTTLRSASTTLNGASTTLSVLQATTLNGAITNTATTIKVASATGFPTGVGQYYIQVDSEVMLVTGGQGTTTWTVTRHQAGTTAAAHANGAAVTLVVGSADTTIKVASAAGFPGAGQYYIQIGSEQMLVTGGQGTTTWTVTRGANGTTAAAHPSAASVVQAVGTGDTTIKVASAAGFPTGATQYSIQIDSEVMVVTGGQGTTTWTVTRHQSGTTAATHLQGAAVAYVIGTGDSTIQVTSAAGFPTTGNYAIQIDSEVMVVTGGQGTTTWTVTRAQSGTAAARHSGGATVNQVVGTTDTTIVVASAIGFPTATPYRIEIDNEQMQVTGVSKTATTMTLTVTRHFNSTTAATHQSGATVSNLDGWTPGPTTAGVWVPVGLSGTDTTTPLPNPAGVAGNYEVNGVPSTSSYIVQAINCIAAASIGTDLATPIAMARWYLDNYGRPGVVKGILLETDGQPQDATAANGLDTLQFTCGAAVAAAQAAKDEGIQVYTVGYGVGSNCPTTSQNSAELPAWSNKSAASLLMALATQPNSPYYFNAPDDATLKTAFTLIASNLAHNSAHLVQLYPAPVVTHAAGPIGNVAITGQYFSGATSVTIGGASVAFAVGSDTSITAQAPARASGTVVHVIVSSPGGSSSISTLDQYTYP